MCSLFYNSTVVDHCDDIGVLNSGQTMGDYNRCTALAGSVQSRLNNLTRSRKNNISKVFSIPYKEEKCCQ